MQILRPSLVLALSVASACSPGSYELHVSSEAPRSGAEPLLRDPTERALVARATSALGECPDTEIDTFPLADLYHPSGWMGDTGALSTRVVEDPALGPAREWTYAPDRGTKGWAGCVYQSPADNWGEKAGRDLSEHEFQYVTFFAKGARGGEYVTFSSGGGTPADAKYPASFQREGPTVKLTSEWKLYSLRLAPKGKRPDLSNVPSAFTFTLSVSSNPSGATFSLAELQLTKATPSRSQ